MKASRFFLWCVLVAEIFQQTKTFGKQQGQAIHYIFFVRNIYPKNNIPKDEKGCRSYPSHKTLLSDKIHLVYKLKPKSFFISSITKEL